MTLPPPPDPYGSQPPQRGGQPGGGVPPQWGSQQGGVPPQGFGGGYGPPPQGPWGPQQQWPGGPGGQPPKSGRGKWILGGIAVVLAIALTVAITVLVVRPADGGGGNGDPTQPNVDSEFASANDIGPVTIITEDPTCGAWSKIARSYADKAKNVNWADRDYSVPASAWTADQRNMYKTVADAMTDAADQTQSLLRQTPHRVMRELYEQFIAYAREFSSTVASYTVEDDPTAVVTDTIGTLTADICSAIEYGASSVAPMVSAGDAPTHSTPLSVETPGRFLLEANDVCPRWESAAERFDAETADWRALDPSVAAKDWTADRRATTDAFTPVLSRSADEIEALGRESGSGLFEDFASLGAQYARGYVAAVPTYTSSDGFLYQIYARVIRTINWACKGAS